MRLTMTMLLAAALSMQAVPRQDSLTVLFWNLENFYDTHDGGQSESDTEFSAHGARHWTRRRYSAKCSAVAKIILKAADRYGSLPDIVGFAEVENRKVVEDIVLDTPLRKLGYRIVHFDSPDHRGIDCALLYRKSSLELSDSAPLHLYGPDGRVLETRDILLARFGELAVLVNHHPSKVGEGSRERRRTAMSRMQSACDSLEAAGVKQILCIGDFNDDVWHSGSPMGTIKYEGGWEKIDGCFHRGFRSMEEHIFDDPSLLTKDTSYGGQKPLRTWSGPRWLGGVSDHLPIVIKTGTSRE